VTDLTPELRRAARLVAAVYDLDPACFLANGKGPPPYVQARQLVAYLLSMEGGFDQKHVATAMGRHHSTVWHAVQKIEALREDGEFDRGMTNLAQMYCRLREAATHIPQAMNEVPE
jgi:chromosomal replication initiation ATPase DnaA